MEVGTQRLAGAAIKTAASTKLGKPMKPLPPCVSIVHLPGGIGASNHNTVPLARPVSIAAAASSMTMAGATVSGAPKPSFDSSSPTSSLQQRPSSSTAIPTAALAAASSVLANPNPRTVQVLNKPGIIKLKPDGSVSNRLVTPKVDNHRVRVIASLAHPHQLTVQGVSTPTPVPLNKPIAKVVGVGSDNAPLPAPSALVASSSSSSSPSSSAAAALSTTPSTPSAAASTSPISTAALTASLSALLEQHQHNQLQQQQQQLSAGLTGLGSSELTNLLALSSLTGTDLSNPSVGADNSQLMATLASTGVNLNPSLSGLQSGLPGLPMLSPLLLLHFIGMTEAAQSFTMKLFEATVGLMPHYESKVALYHFLNTYKVCFDASVFILSRFDLIFSQKKSFSFASESAFDGRSARGAAGRYESTRS